MLGSVWHRGFSWISDFPFGLPKPRALSLALPQLEWSCRLSLIVGQNILFLSALLEVLFLVLVTWSGDQLPVLADSASTEILCQALKQNPNQHMIPWAVCALPKAMPALRTDHLDQPPPTFSRLTMSMASVGSPGPRMREVPGNISISANSSARH